MIAPCSVRYQFPTTVTSARTTSDARRSFAEEMVPIARCQGQHEQLATVDSGSVTLLFPGIAMRLVRPLVLTEVMYSDPVASEVADMTTRETLTMPPNAPV
jgi:hypothetical protein